MPAWSDGGDFSIVCCRQPAQAEKAANVFAAWPKKSACALATGAASAEARPMFLKKFCSWVSGASSVFMTGSRCWKNGLNAAIASLIDAPRPANASPKPFSAVRDASRVGLSNVLKTSSNSTGLPANLSGMVSPGR